MAKDIEELLQKHQKEEMKKMVLIDQEFVESIYEMTEKIIEKKIDLLRADNINIFFSPPTNDKIAKLLTLRNTILKRIQASIK